MNPQPPYPQHQFQHWAQPARRIWPWVLLTAVLATVVTATITVLTMLLLAPAGADNPDPLQVAAFTQNAGTDLYGRGIWTDDALLQIGLAVCDMKTDGLHEAQQIDQLKSRWGGLDDFDTITLMHHANARLCPGTVPS
ncbi:hypothetical protein DMP15_18650 [Pseudonocardia sp. UM4_GMWB1]|jgi:hypothetical protein|uniref:hypothetical protein n=1 Tax=Pseudonocardia sp. UM4_GMWB1 TaxID=2212989 RepID=UPI00307F7E47